MTGRNPKAEKSLMSSAVQDPEEEEVIVMDRKGRIFNPIVFLTKSTVNLVFTTGVTTTQAASATVIFATCVPSDVSSIVGSTCG